MYPEHFSFRILFSLFKVQKSLEKVVVDTLLKVGFLVSTQIRWHDIYKGKCNFLRKINVCTSGGWGTIVVIVSGWIGY